MTTEDKPAKQVAFRAFLQDGWVSVHLDARRPGVDVPPELAGSPHLVLQYGLNMPIPIPDLAVTDDGITATLSFSRQPHTTKIPWSAVYIVACEDGRGVLYYEDVPEEVSLIARSTDGEAATVEVDAGEGTATPAVGVPAEKRRLKSIPLGPEEGATEAKESVKEGDAEGDEASKAKRRRRPQLKLVK